MGVASVLMLTAALASGGSGKAARFAGLAVTRVDLVQQSGSLPEVAPRLVDVAVGDRYDPAAVRRSIKQLFALGTFSDIKVEAQAEAQGVALTFHLYPVLKVEEVVFLGMDDGPANLKDLRKEIVDEGGLRPGTILDTERVEAAVEIINRWLAGEGFFWVRTEPEVRFLSPGARIIFHVETGALARLNSLRVDGVPHHIEQDVRRRIAISPGDPYIPTSVKKRIDKLVAQWKKKGYYEAQVDIQETSEPPDQVEVDIDVKMGRRILIQVEGASVSERTLNRLVPVMKEQSTSEDLIEESRANIEAHFKRQGYRDVVATVERSTYGQGQYLLLAFQVELGTKVRVGEVRVEGLATVMPKEVTSVMATHPGRFRATPFRSRVWDDDLEEIRRYLRRQGFHRASVRGEIHEATGEPDVVDLIVQVDEGPRATIVEIQVDGVEQVDASEALSEAGLEVGSAYYPPRVVEAREHLFGALLNRGYQQAAVDVRSQLDETGTRASLTFEIHEGPQTFVDRVIVSGLEVTHEDALRQQVAVLPEEPLSADGLLETRQRLVGTGLFRDVSVEALPLDASTESSDVLIRVEEGPRTTFGYGVGYNELDLARVDAEVTRRNMFGRNRTASVFARASVKGGRFVLTYRQPEFVGLDVPVFVSAIFEQGERPSFSFIQKSLGFQVTKNQSDRRTYFFRYNYQQTRVFRLEIDPVELPREFRNIRLSTVSASQVTDTRDDTLSPSRGQFRLLNLELSAKFLGTKSPYLKGLAQQFFYFPLPYQMVGVIGLRAGIGQTFREDRDALMPITERFFAGGANTLRGFGLDEASPKDADGNPLGGNVLTLLNLELRFPIAGNLGGVFFSDNGAVYRRLSVIEPLSWRYNLGFGFRYQTPLGPLRVDMGFKLDRRLTTSDEGLVREPLSRIHVSLGHAF